MLEYCALQSIKFFCDGEMKKSWEMDQGHALEEEIIIKVLFIKKSDIFVSKFVFDTHLYLAFVLAIASVTKIIKT